MEVQTDNQQLQQESCSQEYPNPFDGASQREERRQVLVNSQAEVSVRTLIEAIQLAQLKSLIELFTGP